MFKLSFLPIRPRGFGSDHIAAIGTRQIKYSPSPAEDEKKYLPPLTHLTHLYYVKSEPADRNEIRNHKKTTASEVFSSCSCARCFYKDPAPGGWALLRSAPILKLPCVQVGACRCATTV